MARNPLKKLKFLYKIQLGIQILQSLKLVHEAGFVYNDLQPQNIIIGTDSVKLINFGNSIQYLDIYGNLTKSKNKSKFKRNIYLASYSMMN